MVLILKQICQFNEFRFSNGIVLFFSYLPLILQLFTNGNNDSQSHCDATAYTAHVCTPRGKSLSPPKVGANRKQTISSPTYFSRNPNQRHLIRPFNLLRKQKLISKAKQQARLSSPSSPTAMGKTIAKVDLSPKPTNDKPIDTDDKANSSESEYSSLEDDDDIQGKRTINRNCDVM